MSTTASNIGIDRVKIMSPDIIGNNHNQVNVITPISYDNIRLYAMKSLPYLVLDFSVPKIISPENVSIVNFDARFLKVLQEKVQRLLKDNNLILPAIHNWSCNYIELFRYILSIDIPPAIPISCLQNANLNYLKDSGPYYTNNVVTGRVFSNKSYSLVAYNKNQECKIKGITIPKEYKNQYLARIELRAKKGIAVKRFFQRPSLTLNDLQDTAAINSSYTRFIKRLNPLQREGKTINNHSDFFSSLNQILIEEKNPQMNFMKIIKKTITQTGFNSLINSGITESQFFDSIKEIAQRFDCDKMLNQKINHLRLNCPQTNNGDSSFLDEIIDLLQS